MRRRAPGRRCRSGSAWPRRSSGCTRSPCADAHGLAVLASGVDLIGADPRAFEAELTTVQLGAIAVDSLRATTYTAIRTARHVGLTASTWCTSDRALGARSVAQDGRSTGSSSREPRRCCGRSPRIAATPHRAPDSAPRSQVILTTVPMTLLPGKADQIADDDGHALPKTPLWPRRPASSAPCRSGCRSRDRPRPTSSSTRSSISCWPSSPSGRPELLPARIGRGRHPGAYPRLRPAAPARYRTRTAADCDRIRNQHPLSASAIRIRGHLGGFVHSARTAQEGGGANWPTRHCDIWI